MQHQHKKQQLYCHITEDHNEVLHHVYRGIGSKRLALGGNVLLHFDSHPDMLIPNELAASDIYNKDKLFNSISIENWIMPAVYAGHISTVIWIKKPWADQIKDGTYIFYVGRKPDSDVIRCTCAEPYFVSELLYATPESISNIQQLTLHVRTATSDCGALSEDIIKWIPPTSSVILDIDLDYFSTQNPFMCLYTESRLVLLQELYKFEPEVTPTQSSVKREQQLTFLKQQIKEVSERGYIEKDLSSQSADKRLILIRKLVEEEILRSGKIDADLLHEHGCTFDTSGLPQHISSCSEITEYVTEFREIINSLECVPAMITMARSSDDDYCPKDQVDDIQESVLHVIAEKYPSVIICKHYKHENTLL